MTSSDYLDFEKPLLELQNKIEELQNFSDEKGINLTLEIATLKQKEDDIYKEIFANLTPWQRTQIARHPKRPSFSDYLKILFHDFIELHGDRLFRDDPSIVAGIGYFEGQPVTIIGHQKGRDTKENIMRNFDMPNPEGYRKALRLMKQAAKFKRPIITFIDTPGAYPGIEAEERGQGEAIARNLLEMAELRTPIIAIVIGEGGSGGALAIGVANRVLMLENAVYSVISPESCGAILWKDASKAAQAAEALKLTAFDLKQHNVIDEIITEPAGGAHRNPAQAGINLADAIRSNLTELMQSSLSELVEMRYNKFRNLGVFSE